MVPPRSRLRPPSHLGTRATATPADRPRIVVITGVPGSGKSALGTELSRCLQIPFLARDDVRRGLFFTNGAWTDRPGRVPTADEAVDTFLDILEAITSHGVSCIAEYVVRRHRPADLRRITAAGDCVVIRTECRDPLGRFARRHGADRLLNRAPVLAALGHTTIEDHTSAALARMRSVAHEMQTDFDLPTLTVHTDNGYTPDLEAILTFATA